MYVYVYMLKTFNGSYLQYHCSGSKAVIKVPTELRNCTTVKADKFKRYCSMYLGIPLTCKTLTKHTAI